MSELTIRPATRDDVLSLVGRVVNGQADILSLMREHVENGDVRIDEEVAQCAANGSVVAAWGVFPTVPGVATAWALFTPEASKYALRILRATKFHVEHIGREVLGLQRIEAAVDPTNDSELRWALMVGLRPVDVLTDFGPFRKSYLLLTKEWA